MSEPTPQDQPSELAMEIAKAVCIHAGVSIEKWNQHGTHNNELAAVVAAKLAEHERRQWVSVKERMPLLGDRVLVYMASWHTCRETTGRLCEHGWEVSSECIRSDPTHWRPLPAPPVEGK